MTLTRPSTILAILIMAVALGASNASAQAPLPETVSAASPITASDKDAIKGYLAGAVEGLSAKETARIRKSRNDLLRPLRAGQVSTDFRLEYSRQLLPVLDPLATSPNNDVAINTLVVLGEIGTIQSLDAAGKALADQRPPVRLAAVQAFERTFTVARGLGPAIQDSQVKQALARLEAAVAPGKEADPLVVDGFVRAFEAASKVPDTSMPGVRVAALTALAKSIGVRAQDSAASANLHPAFLRAGNAVVDSFKLITEPALPQQTLVEIGGLAGDLLAYALRQLGANNLAPVQFVELRSLVGQAETIVSLASEKLGGKPPPVLNLQATLAAPNGGVEKFRLDVVQLIGRGGALCEPPFSQPPQRFLKR